MIQSSLNLVQRFNLYKNPVDNIDILLIIYICIKALYFHSYMCVIEIAVCLKLRNYRTTSITIKIILKY